VIFGLLKRGGIKARKARSVNFSKLEGAEAILQSLENISSLSFIRVWRKPPCMTDYEESR
jgi:hypothetical protein